jgi:hypothetical protein
MGYAELIQQRLQTLPQEKQAEIYDFVEFIASRSQTLEIPSEEQHKKQVLATLVAARGAWPATDKEKIDQLAANMRAEWDSRGWESAH